MIRRVTISNYRSLGENVVLELGPLTALVGPNSSGKSNVADALMFVADVARSDVKDAVEKRHGFNTICRRGPDRPTEVRLRVDLANDRGEKASYQIELEENRAFGFCIKNEIADGDSSFVDPRLRPSERGDPSRDLSIGQANISAIGLLRLLPRYRGLAAALGEMAVYNIAPESLRKPQEGDRSSLMEKTGANWASILRRADQDHWKKDFIAALRRVTGHIDDFRVTEIQPWLIPEFHHVAGGGDEGRWASVGLESDGTLRMAGIVAALYQSPTPTLVGIEEPELAVHPGMLPLLYDLLKEASTRGQVLITTHSPELLARFDADDVRVVERRDGVTTVGRLAEPQRKVVEDRLMTLGELMLSEPLEQAPAVEG